MKIIAIIINVVYLSLGCYILAKEGIPKQDDVAILIISLIFLSPIVNLWYIYISNRSSKPTSGNLISLYFKRKALEEKLKIANLQQKDSEK